MGRFSYASHALPGHQHNEFASLWVTAFHVSAVFSYIEKFQDNRVDSLWAPAFDDSLVLHTLREDITTTNLIPGECRHLTCLLCITCFVGVSGQQN